MKITLIKFYQGVSLIGPTLASFTPDEGLSDKLQAQGFTAELVEHGVMLYAKRQNMAALVPWNNVAYIRYSESDVTAKADAVAKPKAKTA